jgi:hypothetical protein
MRFFKTKNKESNTESSPTNVTESVNTEPVLNKVKKHVLVIDSEKNNWDALFEQISHNHFEFVIEQCVWKDIVSVTSYNEHKSTTRICTVHMHGSPTALKKSRTQLRYFQPDFVIVRKLVNGLKINSEVCTFFQFY